MSKINEINISNVNIAQYSGRYVGAIVLTKDNKILLQQRLNNWRSFPGYLATFGGKIEESEDPIEALVRELYEELGAIVKPQAVIFLGAITESISNHCDLIYLYFWHDKEGTISGCYECEPTYYNEPADVLSHPKVMQDIIWALDECQKSFLL